MDVSKNITISTSSSGTVLPPNGGVTVGSGYWDGSGYWQWVPYPQPYVPTAQAYPTQYISYDFGLSQKLKLAVEVVKALPAGDPLAIAAREAIANGLK